MKKLATIIATATLATCLAFAGTAYADEQAPASAASPIKEGAVTPVALYMANDYTVFTRAMEDVIGRNATTVQTTIGHDDARTAMEGLLLAGAGNDAAAAEKAASADAAPGAEAAYATVEAFGYSSVASDPAPAPAPSTITMQGLSIPYIDSYFTTSAPQSGAGLWVGSDSTTDGSYGYFIGHNPGSFACMLDMGIGSQVTITDGNGNSRTYTVCDVFDVVNTTTWEEVEHRVTSHGESIGLQCCIQGGAYYRIMVAA